MNRIKVRHTEHFSEVLDALTSRGLLLGAHASGGKPNLMTIGWGTIGAVWGMPIWIVLVRPSRHTFGLIERSGCFTVNVPPASLAAACDLCGTRSGRDVDKFKTFGLTPEQGLRVAAPTVAECPIVYECRTVHTNDVLESRLAKEILSTAYPRGDFHRVYWGEIVETLASPDAAKLLRG
jgi:flavin reductase (DIM6/NTAB) family NADH-FMN oxidoreductase RutF